MSDAPDGDLAAVMQFLYACPVGLVDFDIDGAIGLINPIAMQFLQVIRGSPFVSNFFDAIEACGPELRTLAAAFPDATGVVCDGHRIVVGAGSLDGRVEPRFLACTMIRLHDTRFMATLTDVSRQVAQEQRLRHAEAWLSTLLDESEDFAVLSLDPAGRIEAVSEPFLLKTGLARAGVLGQTLDVLERSDADEPRPTAGALIEKARRHGWHLDERWLRQADGSRQRCQRLIVVRTDDGVAGEPRGFTAIVRTVAGQGFDAAKLRRLLRTDHLTGAYNRSHFFETAERLLQAGAAGRHPLSLVAIDVDHFKQVNDTHGHAKGDDVLRAIALACMGVLRPGDIFARIGGEEFAVLLPGLGLAGAVALAERLRATVAQVALDTATGPLRTTASFGCAEATLETTTVEALLGRADEALYAAKRAGRNRVHARGAAEAG